MNFELLTVNGSSCRAFAEPNNKRGTMESEQERSLFSIQRSAFIISILAEMTGFEPVKGF